VIDVRELDGIDQSCYVEISSDDYSSEEDEIPFDERDGSGGDSSEGEGSESKAKRAKK
jgi:hypothetical protein